MSNNIKIRYKGKRDPMSLAYYRIIHKVSYPYSLMDREYKNPEYTLLYEDLNNIHKLDKINKWTLLWVIYNKDKDGILQKELSSELIDKIIEVEPMSILFLENLNKNIFLKAFNRDNFVGIFFDLDLEFQKEIYYKKPSDVEFINDLDSFIQKDLINSNIDNIKLILQANNEVQEIIMDKNVSYIDYIKNPSVKSVKKLIDSKEFGYQSHYYLNKLLRKYEDEETGQLIYQLLYDASPPVFKDLVRSYEGYKGLANILINELKKG